jgi:hypothetical protein
MPKGISERVFEEESFAGVHGENKLIKVYFP